MTRTEQQNLNRQGPRVQCSGQQAVPRRAVEIGFYADMKKTMGDEGWTLLEKYTGELV